MCRDKSKREHLNYCSSALKQKGPDWDSRLHHVFFWLWPLSECRVYSCSVLKTLFQECRPAVVEDRGGEGGRCPLKS